jgi:hypothetical protein
MKVASELAIPSATPTRDGASGEIDVTIRFGEKPLAIEDPSFRNERIEAGRHDFLFRPINGLAFRIRSGREITISRTRNVADTDVCLFLVGSAWGVLCHQRGLVPLHCSAIEFQNHAVAFTGPSGAGKSTLAAGLSKRGYRHLCDDVCVIDLASERTIVLPMPKGLKLRRDATEALEFERGPVVSTDERLDKYYVSIPEYDGRGPLELSALSVLTDHADNAPGLTRLKGSEHFREVFASIYRYEWLTLIRDRVEVFQMIAELARRLSVFRFSRPRDLTGFENSLTVLEMHMRETLASQ